MPDPCPQFKAMTESARQIRLRIQARLRRFAKATGPEGGFSPDEQTRLRALPQVVPLSLGPRILRADTAAVAVLTLWQAALGDWV